MRKAFIVYVDLDERPGVFHTDEEAKYALGVILNRAIPHYKPEVSLAPLNFQQNDLVGLDQYKREVRQFNKTLKNLPSEKFWDSSTAELLDELRNGVIKLQEAFPETVSEAKTTIYETPNMFKAIPQYDPETDTYDADAYNLGNAGLD